MLKKLTLAGLGLLLFASPALAFAQSLSDLQAQLAALQAMLSATPSNGQAPLPVTFGAFSSSHSDISPSAVGVDFGDGATSTMALIACQPNCDSTPDLSVTHTYATVGEHTAKLVSFANCGTTYPAGCAYDLGPTAIVTISASTSNYFSAGPLSGNEPLLVHFFTWLPDPTTSGHRVDFGDGLSVMLSRCADGVVSCSATPDHTYAAGTYTARMKNPSGGTVGSIAINVASSTTATTTPTGIITAIPSSGPAPLEVSLIFPSAWQSFINAVCESSSGTSNGRSLETVWGDGTFPGGDPIAFSCGPHIFASKGEYTIKADIFDVATNGSRGATVLSASTTISVASGTIGASCLVLAHDMRTGSTDADTDGEVSALQTFLAVDETIYPEGLVTGFYGPATTRAVQRWQKTRDIVGSGTPETTGYGVVGPRTRASFARDCPKLPKIVLSASPNFGAAPLTTQLTASGPSGQYLLELGDGNNQDLAIPFIECPNGIASCPRASTTVSYTYVKNGTYNARLLNNSQALLASTTVTVGTSQALTATATSGPAALVVTFTGNTGGATYFGGVHFEFGDGNTAPFCSPGNNCTTQSVSHTYSIAGTYTATLVGVGEGSNTILGTILITVTGPASCIAPVTHDLQLGDTDIEVGGDVSKLQAVLAKDTAVYPEGLVTGIFGRLTERAVKRFQIKYNISPTGFVGPLTRAAIKALCAGESPSGTKYSFKVKPATGQAPLAVVFTANRIETLQSMTYMVDYGDGTRGDMEEDSDNHLTVDHTYTSGGTFTAKLLLVEDICGGGIATFGCTRELQVDSATVTVTAPVVDVCPNIEGIQTSVPSGMTSEGGNCVSAVVAPPPDPACAGMWSVNVYSGWIATFSIPSVQSDGSFSGTLTFQAVGDAERVSGSCKDGSINFNRPVDPARWGYGGNQNYTGTYSSNQMSGIYTGTGGGGPWSATKNASNSSPPLKSIIQSVLQSIPPF